MASYTVNEVSKPAVAAAAVSIVYFVHVRERVAAIEDLVPADAVYYLYSHDPAKKIDDFSQSAFFQKVAGLGVYRTYAAPAIEEQKEVIGHLKELFDSDAALAVFSPQLFMAPAPAGESPARVGSFLFFIRMDARKNVKKLIGDIYLRFAEKEQITTSDYRSIQITSYTLPADLWWLGSQASYALLGDILVFGNDLDVLKRSIDLFTRAAENALSADSVFLEVAAELRGNQQQALLWNFVNHQEYCRKILQLLEDPAYISTQAPSFDLESFRTFLQNVVQVSKGTVTRIEYDTARKGLLCRSYQAFDKEKDSQNILTMLQSSAPGEESIAGLVPADSLGYLRFAGEPEEFTKYLTNLTALSPEQAHSQGARFRQLLSTVNNRLGLDIEEEILPLLGNEFCLAVSGIEEARLGASGQVSNPLQMFPSPVPQAALYIEAENPVAAQEFIMIFLSKASSSPQKLLKPDTPQEAAAETYKGVEMRLCPLAGFPLVPVLFHIDSYCVFASSLPLAKKIVDVHEGEVVSLAKQPDFAFDNGQLIRRGSFVFYFDFARFIQQLAQTKLVSFLKPAAPFFTQGQVSSDDIDKAIDVLDDITVMTQAYRFSDDNRGRGLVYIGIEGL